MGFAVLVDRVNLNEQYFKAQYHGPNHRAFYLQPFLVGSIPDINFEMMGPPDFCIWFNDLEKVEQDGWKAVAEYMNVCLNGGTCAITTITEAKVFLGTHVVPPCLLGPEDVKEENADGVIHRSGRDFVYSFTDLHQTDRDRMIYSVRKPFVDDPFTIIINDWSKTGGRYFFADLFACPEWGSDRCDVQFLKELWEELQMDGDFDIDELLKERTSQYFPDGENCPTVEPVVLRKSVEECQR